MSWLIKWLLAFCHVLFSCFCSLVSQHWSVVMDIHLKKHSCVFQLLVVFGSFVRYCSCVELCMLSLCLSFCGDYLSLFCLINNCFIWTFLHSLIFIIRNKRYTFDDPILCKKMASHLCYWPEGVFTLYLLYIISLYKGLYICQT